MERVKAIKELRSLAQCEIDSALLLKEAIHKLDNEDFQYYVSLFQMQSKENVEELCLVLDSWDAAPPLFEMDIKGYWMQFQIILQSLINDRSVIKALHNHQKFLLIFYEKALKLDFEKEICKVLEALYQKNKAFSEELELFMKKFNPI